METRTTAVPELEGQRVQVARWKSNAREIPTINKFMKIKKQNLSDLKYLWAIEEDNFHIGHRCHMKNLFILFKCISGGYI